MFLKLCLNRNHQILAEHDRPYKKKEMTVSTSTCILFLTYIINFSFKYIINICNVVCTLYYFTRCSRIGKTMIRNQFLLFFFLIQFDDNFVQRYIEFDHMCVFFQGSTNNMLNIRNLT